MVGLGAGKTTIVRPGRALVYGAGLLAAGFGGSQSFVKGPSSGPLVANMAVDTTAVVAASAAVIASLPEEVFAKGGVYGPLEGKASSLVHPVMMGTLFLTTLYAGFMGLKWRETRLMSADISALKEQEKKLKASEALKVEQDPEGSHPEHPEVMRLKEEIKSVTATRAEMAKAGYKDKHFQISSLILGGGIFFVVYGVFNTWFRTEKLFPGPHLFAGAAICVIWALAASMVPFMEKGDDKARTAHIGLNVVNLGLFAWQLPTGFEIAQKVWGAPIAWI